MKYLKKFETEAKIKSWQMSAECVNPNVVLAGDGGVQYNVPKLRGVFIQHIDGNLYATDDWTAGGFANEQANGVALITNECSFVIAKENISSSMEWSSNDYTLVNGILTTADEATAKTDFAGQENTNLMLATDKRSAGYSCANYTFPNGAKGYLPALGEWSAVYANRTEIKSAMSLIGGMSFSSNVYWSSTQNSANRAWSLSWYNGGMYGQNKYETFYVRAFSAL